MNEENVDHSLETMSSCMNQLRNKGYVEDFTVDAKGIKTTGIKKHYKPEQVTIENFYRFEGDTDPGDSAILYAIETNDGLRGLLTDSYGPYADSVISSFILRVHDIHKQANYTHSGKPVEPAVYH